MFVCALVLAVGLAAVMGILYSNFDGQMRKELSKEAAYLTYGVEQQGVDYLKNIKDKSARITYIGVVLLIAWGIVSVFMPSASEQIGTSSMITIDGNGIFLLICLVAIIAGAVLLLKSTSNK